jgi:hypothetical protein
VLRECDHRLKTPLTSCTSRVFSTLLACWFASRRTLYHRHRSRAATTPGEALH